MINAFKPNSLAERYILQCIIDGVFEAGKSLPSERELADKIGITRTTLREVTSRLAKEGWLTIRHGKPTRVNNHVHTVNLTAMDAMATLDSSLAMSFVDDIFAMRSQIAPAIFSRALVASSENGRRCLEQVGAALLLIASDGDVKKSSLYQKFYDEQETLGIYLEHQEKSVIRSRFLAWLDFELFRGLAVAGGNSLWGMTLNSFRDMYLRLFLHYYLHPGALSVLVKLVTRLKSECSEREPDYQAVMTDFDFEVQKIWRDQKVNFSSEGLEYLKG